ncbi:MAG: UbiA prenyltransferase family protein [Euryarchaeota archaeon]|nr:UbiA prenyltransferase family protein [Euryarchaeota archaeon]
MEPAPAAPSRPDPNPRAEDVLLRGRASPSAAEPGLPPTAGQVIRYLWQLTLPEFWIVAIFPVYIGHVLGSRSMLPSVESILGIIIMGPLIMGSTLMLNEYFDRTIDTRNPRKARSPIQRGLLEPENALHAAGGLMAIGFLLSFAIGPPFALVVGAAILLSLAYSLPGVRFKALGGADLFVNAVGLGILCPLAGYYTVPRPAVAEFPWLFLPVSLFGLAAAYVPTTMMDYEVDKAMGIRSISVRLGLPRAYTLGTLFLATSIATIFTLGLLDLPPFSRQLIEKIGALCATTVVLYAAFIRRMNYRTYWTYLAMISISMGASILLWLLWYTGAWVL